MKRLYYHRRKTHPRDSNNNPKEDMHEVSDGVIWTKLVPDPAADDHETVPDTSSTQDSEDDFCMEVHGDKEWGWDYENMSGDIVRAGERAFKEPEDGNHMKEDGDMIDRVVVSQVVVATCPC